MWQESGKPQNGVVYSVMKRTRHHYHYAVRRCKKQNLECQKQKIAENISDSNKFWREVKRLKTTSKAIANCIDEANGAEEISNVFYEKYRMLYNSVPTDAHELDDLHNTISNDVVPNINVFITPAIIKECLKKLKTGKGDGDRGFKSDHLIHSTHRFHVIIALLFNNMYMVTHQRTS